jgi:hypothetical protein
MRHRKRHTRYTLTHLHEEIERFKVARLYIVGIRGALDLQGNMLTQVLRDGVRTPHQTTPNATSPWLLSVPHAGIGLLHPNPGGRRNRDGTRGRVSIRRRRW